VTRRSARPLLLFCAALAWGGFSARAQSPAAAPGSRPVTVQAGTAGDRKVPIHPGCLYDAMPDWTTGEGKTQSLERCEAENRDIKYEITDNGMILLDQGKDGYFSYQPVYSDKDRMIALVYQNTGGTGTFSFIVDVQYTPNAQGGRDFKIGRSFGGGDRCENGIASVSANAASQSVSIVSDITPGALFELSKEPGMAQRVTNGDLPFCSYCCAGEATYEYKIGSNAPPQLTSLHFDPQKIADMSDQTNIDCFLQVLQSSAYASNNTISPANSDAFLKDFMAKCAHK
jgi:hypothetical protein